jgi:hypothetical protein
MPLAGWLSRRYGDSRLGPRLSALLVWIAFVIAPALAMTQLSAAAVTAPACAPLPLAAAAIADGEQVLRLEAGTPIALRLDLSGSILQAPPAADLKMNLNAPLEVALRDGMPDGRYRLDNGGWHEIREGVLGLKIHRLAPRLENGEPVVRVQAEFSENLLYGEKK